jgi:hypothetical protein
MHKMSEAFADDFHVNSMAIAMIYPIQAIYFISFSLSTKSIKGFDLMINDGCCLKL